MRQLLQRLGRLDEAEPLVREDLDASRETLGSQHPDTLVSINNLAQLLKAQGDMQGARALFAEAVSTGREVLGDDHPDVQDYVEGLRGVEE